MANLLNHGAAPVTLLSIPSVDIRPYGEEAWVSFTALKTAQSLLSLGDGLIQHIPDRIRQPPVTLTGDDPGACGRVDAGAEQRLAGINVPQSGQNVAVHDKLFDRYSPTSAFMEQVISIESAFQWFGTDPFQQRVIKGISLCPERKAEAARVSKSQHQSGFQYEIQVVVLCRRSGCRNNIQSARHPQVNYYAPRIRAQKKVLGAPLQA